MLQDTVGVLCIDMNGNIASAGSSGGIALKLPGRTGQVSFFFASVLKLFNTGSI